MTNIQHIVEALEDHYEKKKMAERTAYIKSSWRFHYITRGIAKRCNGYSHVVQKPKKHNHDIGFSLDPCLAIDHLLSF